MGQDDHRLGQVADQLAALTQEVAQDQLLDVEQVGGAEREGVAAQALQGLGLPADDPADGVLGGVDVLADQPLDLAAQRGVFDEQGVGGEDGAVLLAELVVDGLLVGAGLLGGGLERGAQPPDLRLSLVAFDEALGDAEALVVQHQGRTERHAGGNRDAAFDLHPIPN